jgi:hypothetical protein
VATRTRSRQEAPDTSRAHQRPRFDDADDDELPVAEAEVLQFPNEHRASENTLQSQLPDSAESLAIALESTINYTFHLLNEFAPELLRRHAHHNVTAVRNSDFFSVIMPNLQEVLARLRQLLHRL